MQTSAHIVEVTDASFQTAVVEESRRRPVVVDFWAAWCQPCRMIGPVLERLAEEHEGRFLLAKLDVDANPRAAAAFRIQSIPAVKAFVGGQVANEFVGAVPEESIRRFLETVLPTETDRLTAEAEEAEQEGRTDEAERLYRLALEREPDAPAPALGLARLAGLRGNLDEARRLLEPLRPNPEAERLLAAVEVSGWGAAPGNGRGPVEEAERAAAEGRWRDALEGFLGEIREGGAERDRAREGMLKVFSILGEDDPLTPEYRRRLAAALF